MKTILLITLLAFASSSFAFTTIEPSSSEVPSTVQSVLSSPLYKEALAQLEGSKAFAPSATYAKGTFVAGYTVTSQSKFQGHVEIRIGATPNMWPSCTEQVATISADIRFFPDGPNGLLADNFVVTKLSQPISQCK